jgi:PKD repeat protein
MIFVSGCRKDADEEEPPQEETVIPETTKVIANDTWEDNFTGIDSSSYTLYFKKDLLTETPLKAGDVIVSTEGYGLLRKVKSISQENGKVKVETEFATLTDAIQKGSGSFKVKLTTSNIKKVNYLAKGVSIKNLNEKNMENSQLEYNINTYLDPEHKIKVYGSFALTPDISGDIDIDWGFFSADVEHFEINYEVTQTLELGAQIDLLDLSYEKEIKLVSQEFGKITIMFGSVPVIIIPELEIYGGVEASVYCGVNTNVHEEMSYTLGLDYDGSHWKTNKSFSKSFNYNPPEISCNANAKVYIKPELKFKIYGFVGPYLFGDLYGRFEADIQQTPWWSLYVGTDLGIGVFAEIFDKELMDYATDPPPIIFENLIASAPEEELPVADFEADVTTGNAPLTVHFTDKSIGNPTEWLWNFGDGTNSTEQNPTHIYSNPGSYTVSLKATNESGSDTKTKQNYITVTSGGGGSGFYDGFAITANKYLPTENLVQAVKNELGNDYVIADWNDLKIYAQTHNIENWADQIGITDQNVNCWVLKSGQGFWNEGRHYFIERHDHNPPAFFLVHDDIDDHFIDLGSWHGVKMRILAKKIN